ncbi:ABC transporter ATP-binding protein [Secundilactobacillus folii]|uniref:ATP-binding cassette domain-containing protein n=1 Tax=Secundilactobacillus folii TaxID=2678357 RepID=A0A7X2XUI1_9LACO|nr:ATP-binding cassette domain-containing protein [Secundilactobacillus folii]MTV81828.1 ATP-binding cassette domain-containing protein [Secundilactobacillus folii]
MAELIFDIQELNYVVGDHQILHSMTTQIEKGANLTIEGPSGSGKSTFLRLLATLLTPTSGTILFEGRNQLEYPKIKYRQQVSYCFQQPTLFGETVRDNLKFPFEIRNAAFDEQKVLTSLESVELSADMIDQQITKLSGGEKQRVALVRNLLFTPKVLLLDEISAGLDADTKGVVHRLIQSYRASGVTVISVTHDETEIAAADDLIEIRNGQLGVPSHE